MNKEIVLKDIADELLILNKHTINSLFALDNCSDCIALYVFYYKTAKWQKTNTIKANDTYVKKSLKWGEDRIRKTKQTLKENGLINIIQKRENGKIVGWFVEISYLVQQKKIDEIKIKVENSNNTQNQEVDFNNTQNQEVVKARNGEQETNALKEYIKCLKNELEMLKNKNNNNGQSKEELINEFEQLWSIYPNKKGKSKAFQHYKKARKTYSYEQIETGLRAYIFYIKEKKIDMQYVKNGSTWFNQECWNDDYTVTKKSELSREEQGYAF